MTVRVEEWTQSHWITPNVHLYANYGDYYELSNLVPTRDGRQLRRLPAWSSQVRTDTNAVEDLREQRDEARRFLADLQHTLAAVEALTVGHEPESGLRALLVRMAASARCRKSYGAPPASDK